MKAPWIHFIITNTIDYTTNSKVWTQNKIWEARSEDLIYANVISYVCMSPSVHASFGVTQGTKSKFHPLMWHPYLFCKSHSLSFFGAHHPLFHTTLSLSLSLSSVPHCPNNQSLVWVFSPFSVLQFQPLCNWLLVSFVAYAFAFVFYVPLLFLFCKSEVENGNVGSLQCWLMIFSVLLVINEGNLKGYVGYICFVHEEVLFWTLSSQEACLKCAATKSQLF